jgi:hypothetical protein
MKRFIALLMFVATLASAQQYITVTPVVASTAIASVTLATGNDTITVAASGFSGITKNAAIYGVGIPYGTYVKKCVDTSTTIVMSAVATQGGSKVINFGVLEPNLETYATGDWFGLPFRVYQNTGQGGSQTLVSAEISDNADVLGNTDIVFFNAYSDTLGQDTVAAGIVATEAHKVLGAIALSTATDFGGARSLQSTNIQMALPKENLYARLIARSSMKPTAITNIRVKLGFK